MKRIRFLISIFLLLGLSFSGCSFKQQEAKTLLATTYNQDFVIESISGNSFVSNLLDVDSYSVIAYPKNNKEIRFNSIIHKNGNFVSPEYLGKKVANIVEHIK